MRRRTLSRVLAILICTAMVFDSQAVSVMAEQERIIENKEVLSKLSISGYEENELLTESQINDSLNHPNGGVDLDFDNEETDSTILKEDDKKEHMNYGNESENAVINDYNVSEIEADRVVGNPRQWGNGGIQNRINEIYQRFPQGTTFNVDNSLSSIDPQAANVWGECWACYAFARYAFCHIFGYYKPSYITININDINNRAVIGDFISFNGQHEGIYLGGSGNQFYIYEGNYGNGIINYENPHVTGEFYTVCRIYHATNYDEVNGPINNRPKGCVDVIEVSSDGKLHVRGWAYDPDDTSKSVLIHVYVGEQTSVSHTTPDHIITANTSRPDVNNAYPGVGNNHGFDAYITTSKKGRQHVYVWGIDAQTGENNTYLDSNNVNGKEVSIPSDTQKPTVSNVQCISKDRNGYTLKCNVNDNVGVSKVQFATCTQASGKTDWKYYEVKPTNNTATCTIKTSDFGDKEGQYYTDIYAYDAVGNKSDVSSYSVFIDKTRPVVTSAKVISYDNEGFTVQAMATDNVGITKIQFPTYPSGDSEESIIWHEGSAVVDGTSTCRINASDYNYKKGKFTIEIRAYDADGNMSKIVPGTSRIWHVIDETAPIISNVRTEQISDDTIRVSCDVTDNIDVSKVSFPTWTEKNSELETDIWNSYEGQKNGNTWSFLVKDSNHRFDRTNYFTEIHAKDKYNNEAVNEKITYNFTDLFESNIRFEYNGHLYEVYDDILTWEQAKSKCEEFGGHLVTITSSEEQAAITAAIKNAVRIRYYIGAKIGDNTWITGEPITYTNWGSGQPDNSQGIEDKYEIYNHDKKGTWNDTSGNALWGEGFICEYENLDKKEIGLKGISLSKTNIKINEGDSTRLEVIFSPKNTTIEKNVNWSTSDASIVTVENGVITGLKSGTANITAEVGGKKAICAVMVEKRITEVLVNPQNSRLFVGQGAKLHISTNTGTVPADRIAIANSNPAIVSCSADLDNGTISIKGLSEGNAVITVKIDGIEARASIDVLMPKIVFKNQDGSDLSITPINAIYGEKYPELPVPVEEGKTFIGWYTGADCSGTLITSDTVFEGADVLYAAWVQDDARLRIIMSDEYKYTGSKINPQIRVYDGTALLTENTDYTIAYKNNTNAYTLSEDDPGFNAVKAPTVIITGKGNYSSKETVYFKILPQDISGDDFDSDNIVLAYTGKNQKVKPALCWNGRALKSGTDYTAQIFRASDTGFSSPLGESVKEAGDYVICLTGRGNFAQKRYIDLKVTDDHKPVSRLSYSKVPDVSYTGDEIRPEPVVRDGKTVLAKDEHYTLSYESNADVGTGYVLVTGLPQGGYAGVKRIAFKIKGTPLKKATVNGIAKSYRFTGNEISVKDDELKLYIKSTKKTPQINLTRDTDYTVSYMNNIKAGTASIILNGKGGYTGSVKKTFKINKYSITNDTEGRFIVDCAETADYAKGGARPSVTISYRNADGSISALKEGTDYKLTFKNNTSLTGRGLPTVTITGMGNYEGTRNVTFTISEKDISAVSMEAADKVYKNKAGSYAASVVLKDTDGKKLKAGKDYDKKIRYEYASDAAVIVSGKEEMRASGEEVGNKDIIPAGTMIRAIVTAEPGSGYTGTISGTYRIVRTGIGSMKAVIPAQEYTGKEITLNPANITVKAGKAVLKPYDEVTGEGDYIITGYSDNIRKGKAKVTFRGVGNYGGTKTVTFNIRAKGIKWWWR